MVAIPEPSSNEAIASRGPSGPARDDATTSSPIRTRALTARQERRLVEYVEDKAQAPVRDDGDRERENVVGCPRGEGVSRCVVYRAICGEVAELGSI